MLAPKSLRAGAVVVFGWFLRVFSSRLDEPIAQERPSEPDFTRDGQRAPRSGARTCGTRVFWLNVERELLAAARAFESWRLGRDPEVVEDLAHDQTIADQSDQFSLDVIYGRNINGENADWITVGTTIRFPVK